MYSPKQEKESRGEIVEHFPEESSFPSLAVKSALLLSIAVQYLWFSVWKKMFEEDVLKSCESLWSQMIMVMVAAEAVVWRSQKLRGEKKKRANKYFEKNPLDVDSIISTAAPSSLSFNLFTCFPRRLSSWIVIDTLITTCQLPLLWLWTSRPHLSHL